MSSPHTYWHIYPQEQIKSSLHGRLVCVLQVPWVPSSPVIRDVVDGPGRKLNSTAVAFPALLHHDHHGILYVGVSEPAIRRLLLTDPQIQSRDPSYASYNRQIITNARNFFLQDPNLGFKTMPQHMVQLL